MKGGKDGVRKYKILSRHQIPIGTPATLMAPLRIEGASGEGASGDASEEAELVSEEGEGDLTAGLCL